MVVRDELVSSILKSSFWTPPRGDNAIARTKRPLGPHRLHERQDANDLHGTFQVVSEHMQAHFRTDAWQCLVRKCVEPIHALSVPKGCSTVCRRSRDASGVLSKRFCIASRTRSCSQRAMRRYWLVVHCALIGHFGHAEDQYLCKVMPFSTVVKRQMAR